MTAALPIAVTAIPSLVMDEAELCKVLESSVYPGAELSSIKLVIGVCRAAHLDPLQKPYHIVPMDVKVKRPKKKDTDKDEFDYVKRDVVMPGIGLYRIQAERSGEYAGCSEPEFGPTQKLSWKEKYQEDENAPQQEREVSFEYPEWCRMSVRRMVNGQIVEFAHKEFWIENYATKGRHAKQPNAMWFKRPRGQIAKCTEAQLLRKGFPSIGAQPTAEEMEGKTLDADSVIEGTVTARSIEQPKQLNESGAPASATTSANPSETGAGSGGGAPDGKKDEPFKPMIEGQKKMLRARLKNAKLTELDLKAQFQKDLEAADAAGFAFCDYAAIEKWISENAKQ